MSKTKIVCTIGPACRSTDVMERLIAAGMNVARLNFSHGTHAEHGEVIAAIRHIASKLGHPVAIIQDLSGQKIRIGQIKGGSVVIQPGSLLTLTTRQVPGDEHEISVTYSDLPRDVGRGDTLLLNDGLLELEVLETTSEDIKCKIQIGGVLGSHKGINVPTSSIKAPAMTDKDREDMAFGIQQQVDYVALSFVRKASDVLEAKGFMEERGCAIPVIGKIEKHEALENIDEIIEVVDAVMVARGDLGVETPLEKGPLVQKLLIEKSNVAGKPVITATQMLRSMVDNPRPTRAEVTDVANAVLDGTDALMLSEETAVGKYPVEAVAMMAKIAEHAESALPSDAWTQRPNAKRVKPMEEAVGYAACELARDINAASIITFTHSGGTARQVAKNRPLHPVLALTPQEKTYRCLSLVWGVIPILTEATRDTDQMVETALAEALKSGLVQRGQKVVITAGAPVGVPGTTDLIKVRTVGRQG